MTKANDLDISADSRKGDIGGNAEKDPSDWVTGDEKMTGAKRVI